MDKFYYCPICGETTFKDTNFCPRCKNYIHACESIFEADYYRDKALKIYGNIGDCRQVLIDEEVSINPLYNPNTEIHNGEQEYNQNIRAIFEDKGELNIPKCPTCGSANIKKIPTLSKITGAALFGLFSKTARSQFECQNCHYKW